MADRKGDWIRTYSGRQFWPLDPRPEEVYLVDIAHSLSQQCRFTGHCRTFYSVAQHSLLVADLVGPQNRLWALLHDAAEAYLCDVARPVKRDSMMRPYREAEEAVMRAICDDFALPYEQPEEVSVADKVMLGLEAADLMGVERGQGWDKWLAMVDDFRSHSPYLLSRVQRWLGVWMLLERPNPKAIADYFEESILEEVDKRAKGAVEVQGE